MFKEQYRRDNERLHAREDLLMEIKKKAGEPGAAPRRNAVLRYGAVAAAVLLVFGGVFGIMRYAGGQGAGEQEKLMVASAAEAAEGPVTLADYDELYALMMESRRGMWLDGGEDFAKEEAAVSDAAMPAAPMPKPAAEPMAEAPAGEMAGAGTEGAERNTASGAGAYSETNTQVRGVDEADIVKTDGDYIYYLTGEELIIVRADGTNSRVLSKTAYQPGGGDGFYGYGAWEMFLLDDRLVILMGGQANIWARGQELYQEHTYAAIYDIGNRARPRLLTTLGQSGNYVSSRLVDGYVYLVTTQHVYQPIEGVPASFCPVLLRDGVSKTLAVSDILVGDRANTNCYTVVSSINAAQEKAECSVKAVLGNAGDIYCNADRLLVAAGYTDVNKSDIAPDQNGKNVQVTTSASRTQLVLFSLSGGRIERIAEGSVRGRLLNQFAMDEYEGVFRVVTTVNDWTERIFTDGVDTYEWEDETYNCLYTLDTRLAVLGSIENLAKDEWVESVRFDGDIAYFVTFRQVDPLFTVDLSDPAKPAILSTLKIPGFSEYLHLFAQGRLLGVGYDADEKSGWRQGVKLSMFDTSDKADVKELATKRISADWTPVGQNHKSILVSAARNLIAFPADDCYYVFSYTDAEGFVQRGKLQSDGGWGDRLRGLFIGELLYICSDTRVTVIALSDFSVLHTVKF